jgi:hypothetical protein
VRRVAGLWRRFKLVSDILQILTKRAQHVGTDVAAQDNFAVRCYGDNQVRHLKADLLQPQADKDISVGENAFERSDNICHRSMLWEVCVRVAGPNVASRRSVARAKRNAARREAGAAPCFSRQ